MTESVLCKALDDSFELICGVLAIQTVAESGDEARALQMLAALQPVCSELSARVGRLSHGIAVAQAEAEKVGHLPQLKLVCFAGFTDPQPHPDTANTQSPPPQPPRPIVA